MQLPQMAKVKQHFPDEYLSDVSGSVKKSLIESGIKVFVIESRSKVAVARQPLSSKTVTVYIPACRLYIESESCGVLSQE